MCFLRCECTAKLCFFCGCCFKKHCQLYFMYIVQLLTNLFVLVRLRSGCGQVFCLLYKFIRFIAPQSMFFAQNQDHSRRNFLELIILLKNLSFFVFGTSSSQLNKGLVLSKKYCSFSYLNIIPFFVQYLFYKKYLVSYI